jgi:hypothetical protein
MDIVSSIDLAGLLDVRICGQRFFDETTHLLFVACVPFNGFHDQAMGGTARLPG